MLFKKSLEEFYREELFKSVDNCPDCQEYLPLNADRYIAMSLLQKAIRRGEFGFAFSSALTLLNLNDRAFWKRMCVIVFEDIGIANIDLIGKKHSNPDVMTTTQSQSILNVCYRKLIVY